MSDRPPNDPSWPERDLRAGESPANPAPEADPTADEQPYEPWDPRRHFDRRRPTTAEQAVPWLIGIILGQTGMLVVLLALIFTGTGGVGGVDGSPTPTPFYFSPPPSLSIEPQPSESSGPSEEPTPTPGPSFGPLEMVYLGRATPVAPIDLLRRDFSTADAATVVASNPAGIDRMVWAPNGELGVALVGGQALVITADADPRAIGTGISAVTFGPDSATVYAVRVARDGVNDVASILEIDVVSGGTVTLATTTYVHPEIVNDPPLREAQYADNGGIVRVWYTTEDTLIVYILGAPSLYRVEVASGDLSEAEREPVLASPNRRWEIVVVEQSLGSSDLQLRNRVSGNIESQVHISGLASHIRWAPTSNEIVFTLGYLSPGGGVRQDLFVWDLREGVTPATLTNNGASFGAEWLGVGQAWYE